MAMEPIVAVDFLGLGKSLRERESELIAEKERGKLVKPTASLPLLSDQSLARRHASDGDRETSRSRLMSGTDTSHISGPLAFSLAQATPWASMEGKAEEMERSRLASAAVEKPVEELTDADIKGLSGDECRRYMMKIKKEREMPRPTATMAPMMKTRLRIETREEDEKPASKRGGSAFKTGLSDAASHAAQSGQSAQLDVGGPFSAAGVRIGFQAPRHILQSQSASGEDGPGGARPSDRSVHALDSSLSSPPKREQLLAQSSEFGSPLPPLLRMLRPPEHAQRSAQVTQSGRGSGIQVGATSRSMGQSHLPGRPPTAQLTIFYSGTVNVYDDVPADKAQAIMLLAGSGSSWSSNIMNPPASVSARPSSAGGVASSSNSPAQTGPAPAVAGVTQAGPVMSPLVPTVAVASGAKQVTGRPTLHAELPQARKASLARFLEKRKDRVRGKAPYMPPIFPVKKDVGSSTPPREKSPSPSISKGQTRSPSPVNIGARLNIVSRNRSPSPASRPGPSQRSGSETSSPTRWPPAPQQVPQPSSSEDQASTSAAQRSSKEDLMDWRSQQQSHFCSQEKKPELLEESKGSPSQRH